MNDEIKEIKLDHFKNIEELKQNVETWIKEDEIYWNRWFGLSDLNNLLDYITNLQKGNERLKDLYNKEIYKRFKAHNYIFKNMICDALYPASKVDGENVINILNGGILNGGDEE